MHNHEHKRMCYAMTDRRIGELVRLRCEIGDAPMSARGAHGGASGGTRRDAQWRPSQSAKQEDNFFKSSKWRSVVWQSKCSLGSHEYVCERTTTPARATHSTAVAARGSLAEPDCADSCTLSPVAALALICSVFASTGTIRLVKLNGFLEKERLRDEMGHDNR